MPTTRVKINPFIDVQVWRRFKATCALLNRWPSDVIEDFMKEWLNEHEQKARSEAASDDHE